MFRNSREIGFGGIWTGTTLLKQTKSLENHSVPEPSDKFLLFCDLMSLCRQATICLLWGWGKGGEDCPHSHLRLLSTKNWEQTAFTCSQGQISVPICLELHFLFCHAWHLSLGRLLADTEINSFVTLLQELCRKLMEADRLHITIQKLQAGLIQIDLHFVDK